MNELSSDCYFRIRNNDSKVPEGCNITTRLCAETNFRASRIEDFHHSIFPEAAPYFVKDMLDNALFWGQEDMTITRILDYCDSKVFFPFECAYIRTWLCNVEARKLLIDEIGL